MRREITSVGLGAITYKRQNTVKINYYFVKVIRDLQIDFTIKILKVRLAVVVTNDLSKSLRESRSWT